ncbi:hypothetical protein Tco_0072994 [Tanacetum coccineum]
MKIKRLRRQETPRIVGDDSARSEPTEVADSNNFKPLLKEKRLKEQTHKGKKINVDTNALVGENIIGDYWNATTKGKRKLLTFTREVWNKSTKALKKILVCLLLTRRWNKKGYTSLDRERKRKEGRIRWPRNTVKNFVGLATNAAQRKRKKKWFLDCLEGYVVQEEKVGRKGCSLKRTSIARIQGLTNGEEEAIRDCYKRFIDMVKVYHETARCPEMRSQEEKWEKRPTTTNKKTSELFCRGGNTTE